MLTEIEPEAVQSAPELLDRFLEGVFSLSRGLIICIIFNGLPKNLNSLH